MQAARQVMTVPHATPNSSGRCSGPYPLGSAGPIEPSPNRRPMKPCLPRGVVDVARVRQARRCRARRRDGQPCRAWAMEDGVVCRAHGGAAGQVKAAARKRREVDDLERAFAAAYAKYLRDLRDWQTSRIAVASDLMRIPPEDFIRPDGQVNELMLAFCRGWYGSPDGFENAPTMRIDGRFRRAWP